MQVALVDLDENDDRVMLVNSATAWWRTRQLDTGYLQHGPRLCLWREEQIIHLRWDNRELLERGMPVWAADVGETTFTVGAFLEEMRSFDQRLMTAMTIRIEEARRAWARPEVHLDIDALAREHDERMHHLADVLAGIAQGNLPNHAEWKVARAAIARIDRELTA